LVIAWRALSVNGMQWLMARCDLDHIPAGMKQFFGLVIDATSVNLQPKRFDDGCPCRDISRQRLPEILWA
jgi:hypothetical protein